MLMKIAIDFGQLYSDLPGFRFTTGASGTPLGSIISILLPYLLVLAGLLLLLYLLYGGFAYMTSAGDPKKLEAAKDKLTGALIGFIIVFVSFWLVQIVGRVFGIEPIIDIFG